MQPVYIVCKRKVLGFKLNIHQVLIFHHPEWHLWKHLLRNIKKHFFCRLGLRGLDKPLRFWWTESPLKSAQKSTRESRSTQKRALEYKCTRLSAQKSAQTSSTAQTRAQKIAQKSKTLKKAPKRVGFSRKCSGECVIQKRGVLKRVCYS